MRESKSVDTYIKNEGKDEADHSPI